MTLKLVLMEPFPLYFGHYSTPNKLLSICHNHHVFNKYQIHYCHLKNPRRRKPFLLNINGDKRRLSSITAASTAGGGGGGGGGGVPLPPLDLTEDNVRLVMAEARVELAQLFDTSVGITGVAELAELDGPFVKISLRGRFWHQRSTVVARLGNYLKQRIPEILEVDIEDEKQLDDSPENF
ncbi:uncharacterized protein LOC123212581 [Mangifera indica]|uniref:uncharacterized protein LOC123212581 n=1 Tax=Mangifera indica TaxID=29780 RepID=UPI001CF9AC45|nr:uncharacterized protein LOC123212581 [Mangifera indica]